MPNLPVDVNSWGRSACYPQGNFYPLSDGISIQNRRITNSYFRNCSGCIPRSKAGLCVCTSRHDFRPCRANHRAPPLQFRRRPPQSNCPPDNVPRPDNGRRLEPYTFQGGIPKVTQLELAPQRRSLPPILYKNEQNSISRYSKAPWGLSVLPRETGIFTGTTISPGGQLRQRPDRYAIHAGRNLPDKEFRYLHRAGVSPYTSSYDLAQTCVFDKQSPGPLHCDLTHVRYPFSRSYRVILPSSLTTLHPLALEYSSHPPVSDYGTGIKDKTHNFSRSWVRLLLY